jgi:hypothetical protein
MTDPSPAQLAPPSNNENSQATEPSSAALRYPQILLETSFDSLLTHSYPSDPASSTTMEAPQRGPASLSESWASISDAELSTDDELHSEHTDLGSLIDIHSVGDLQSVRDEETSSEADHDADDEQAGEKEDSALRMPVHTPISNSVVGQDFLEYGMLTLQETSDSNDADVTVAKKAVRKFFPDELRQLQPPFREDVDAAIQMPLGKEYIKDAGRHLFQVLLCRQVSSFGPDNAILHKLGDAQLSSDPDSRAASPPSPSKYHVIPDTFGPGSEPAAAAIVPVDYQLDIAHYETATFEAADSTSGSIFLGNRDDPKRTVSRYDAKHEDGPYTIVGAQIDSPDLAIVVVDDLSEANNRDFARASLTFARRHGIPAICLRRNGEWISEPWLGGFIENGLHLRVSSTRNPGDMGLRTIPIDVDMFLSLSPGQLSRHIRHLMERSRGFAKSHQPVVAVNEKEHYDVEKNVGDVNIVRRPSKSTSLKTILDTVMVYLIFMLCGLIVLYGLAAVKSGLEMMRNRGSGVGFRPLANRPRETTTAGPATAVIDQPKRSPSNDLWDLFVELAEPGKDTFEVEVVGNSHLVVRTARERPIQDTLAVSINRQGKPLQVEVRNLFPSVWSVRLEADQAYGELNLQLSTKRSPLRETVTVNLGQQPLDAWFKNLLDETENKIQLRLALLQDALEDLRKQERPQHFVKDIQARVSQMMDRVDRTLRSPEWHDRAFEVKNAVQKQADIIAAHASIYAGHVGIQMKDFARLSASNGQMLASQFSCDLNRARAALVDFHLGDRVNHIWRSVREGTQSETLATAQERAHHVVSDIRERIAKRKA